MSKEQLFVLFLVNLLNQDVTSVIQMILQALNHLRSTATIESWIRIELNFMFQNTVLNLHMMKTKRYPPLIATIVLLYLLLAKALWMGSKCSEVSLGNWPKSFIRWSAFKSEDIPWMSCSEAMWAKALFTRSVHRDFIKYFSSPSWNNHATRNQYMKTYSIMQTKILPLIFI